MHVIHSNSGISLHLNYLLNGYLNYLSSEKWRNKSEYFAERVPRFHLVHFSVNSNKSCKIHAQYRIFHFIPVIENYWKQILLRYDQDAAEKVIPAMIGPSPCWNVSCHILVVERRCRWIKYALTVPRLKVWQIKPIGGHPAAPVRNEKGSSCLK